MAHHIGFSASSPLRRLFPAVLCCWFVIAGAVALPARPLPERGRETEPAVQASTYPNYQATAHTVGRLYLPVTNGGILGRGYVSGDRDVFTGETINYCEFPNGSYRVYMTDAGLWVGGIRDRDTLVSTSADGVSRNREFQPEAEPGGNIIYRSNLDPTSPRYEGAISEQDFICTYYDTCRTCPGIRADIYDNSSYQPLGLEVIQRSYAWSYSYAQDLVLLDYTIRNVGDKRLTDIFVGFHVDGDISTSIPVYNSHWGGDDVCGFIKYTPATYLKPPCAQDSDLVNLAWSADDDGDLNLPQEYTHVPSVTGLKIVSAPSRDLKVSFNWWHSDWDPEFDFGPQSRGSYRDMGYGNTGTPWGNRNMYHVLSNGEQDYDVVRIYQISELDADWMPPPPGLADTLLIDFDTRYLLSFGAFGLDPGQSLPITLAYVAGSRFHWSGAATDGLPESPGYWYHEVHFDSLLINAQWADWIYDNPGVDSDSDGYAGEFTLCNYGDDSTLVCDTTLDTTATPDTTVVACRWEYDIVDTVWRTGDGVPDFSGATPPPNPSTYHFVNQHGDTLRGLRVQPSVGKIRVIWNGVLSENTPDRFTRLYDFEGYNVYIARDNRPTSFSIAVSHDRENYNIWEWDETAREFAIKTRPFSLLELRCMFADSCNDPHWFPEQYPRNHPLVIYGGPKKDDVVLYFERQGYNRAVFAGEPGATTEIRKVYPEAPKPPVVDPDSIAYYFPERDDTLYFTPDGFLKYYEYEYTFDNLLPTVSYWVNVTAFDYGFREKGLPGLETSPALEPVGTYALPSSDLIAQENLKVFVYPNPYRKDAGYRGLDFEGREHLDYPDDHVRLIHFANLPPRCTIRVFSLDGDLIREIKHDVDPIDHLANHATWDLINRNFQLVVSGLYYWTVEDDTGRTQIGKLVIIM